MKSIILLSALLISNFSFAEYEYCGNASTIGEVNKAVPMNQSCNPALWQAESKAKTNCFLNVIDECIVRYGTECNWTVPTYDGQLTSSCTPSSSLNFLNIYAAHVCEVDCYKEVPADPDQSGN